MQPTEFPELHGAMLARLNDDEFFELRQNRF